jgi:heme/copper-type cytochrome/quinol oxidase subunit 2
MHFDVQALSPDVYSKWVAAQRATGPILGLTTYAALAKPGEDVGLRAYRAVDPGLFDAIVQETETGTFGGTPGQSRPRSKKSL